MHEQSLRHTTNLENFRRPKLAALMTTLALAGGAVVPEQAAEPLPQPGAPSEYQTQLGSHDLPHLGNLVLTAAESKAKQLPPNMDQGEGKVTVPQKYWFGPKFELHVIKQQGHEKNAKLAHAIAFKQPWYSHRQMYCVDPLWYKESKFNKYATNTSSGAYGIPQSLPGSKMRAAGRRWRNSAKVQIRWGFNRYIEPVYHTPCGAWRHSVIFNWY